MVGAGISNAVIANELKKDFEIDIIDEREIIGGNCSDRIEDGILRQLYGPHIFHTSNKDIWQYLENFCEMIPVCHQVITSDGFPLPFNMNTFQSLFGNGHSITPEEAMKMIEKDRIPNDNPKNLEEQALALVGKTIYNKFIKEYTEKQWGRSCKELSPDIIKRIPLRFNFDNSYFNDPYVGLPKEGFTKMIEKMFEGCNMILGKKFSNDMEKDYYHVFFSGKIDEYYKYKFGRLDYRTVSWNDKWINIESYQGCPVMNFTYKSQSFTRRIEWKEFANAHVKNNKTLISEEYPNGNYKNPCEAYPIDNEENRLKYSEYSSIENHKVSFVGRLGWYQYLDMDKVIEKSLNVAREFHEKHVKKLLYDCAVLIPLYNNKQYLERCLESLDVDNLNAYLIICNDGSVEDVEEVLFPFFETHNTHNILIDEENHKILNNVNNKIHYIKHFNNRGTMICFCDLIHYAKKLGVKYIGWQDPDDWCDKGYHNELFKIMKRMPEGTECIQTKDVDTKNNWNVCHWVFTKVFLLDSLIEYIKNQPFIFPCISNIDVFLSNHVIDKTIIVNTSKRYHYIVYPTSISSSINKLCNIFKFTWISEKINKKKKPSKLMCYTLTFY